MHYQTIIFKYTQLSLFICLAIAALLVDAKVLGTPQNQSIQNNPSGQQIQTGQTPDGLSAPDWSNIQQQISTGQYRAYSNPSGGYNSSNPTHGWAIHYGVDGSTTLSQRERNATAYHLRLKLSAIGYQSPDQALKFLHRPQTISSQDNILEYHWNDILTERWVNSVTDLEQWFLLDQRPKGAASRQPLTLQMTVGSDLRITQEGNNIRFVNSSGSTTITYNKLKVWDADGHNLPAQMHLVKQQLSLWSLTTAQPDIHSLLTPVFNNRLISKHPTQMRKTNLAALSPSQEIQWWSAQNMRMQPMCSPAAPAFGASKHI